MRSVIESNLTGKEGVQWIECRIEGPEDERIYYILCFKNRLDVLEVNKTMFAPGTDFIVKPFFSLNKIGGYSIFNLPASDALWKISSSLYINEDLKKVIQQQRLTGVDFEEITVG